MSRMLGIVYRAIETLLIQRARCTRATPKHWHRHKVIACIKDPAVVKRVLDHLCSSWRCTSTTASMS